jgi:hypothetical protein
VFRAGLEPGTPVKVALIRMRTMNLSVGCRGMESLSINIRLDSGRDVRVKLRYYERELFGSATATYGRPLSMQEVDETQDKLDRTIREARLRVVRASL